MSETAWNVIGVIPWIVLAAILTPALTNGRELLFGLPTGWPSGWRLRIFAFFGLGASAYMISSILTHGVYWDGVLITYVGIATYVVWAAYRWRKARSRSAAR